MADFEPLPPLIRNAEGRLIPFEPETICRRLFAVTQFQGRPDSFLARELTDGVLHFIGHSDPAVAWTTADVDELVVKVVRELGHPSLAKLYESQRPDPSPVGTPEKTGVYPADLRSAHEDGLLWLTDRETPTRLAGCAIGAHGPLHPDGLSIARAVARASLVAGRFVAVDGSEAVLAESGGDPNRYVRELVAALRSDELLGVVNLNAAAPPVWAVDPHTGPLFENVASERESASRERLADALLEALAANASEPVPQLWWHLGERDFLPEAVPRLQRVIDLASRGQPIEFVFDRPRKSVLLGPGLDRNTPAVLSMVGVNLWHLVRQMGEEPLSSSLFLKNLGILARFAKTAGHVRQDYLRDHGDPSLREGFLLDRTPFVLIPLNLDAAVRAVLGTTSADSNAVAELAGEALTALREALQADRPRSMFCRLDSAVEENDAIALRDAHLLPRQQVRYGGALQHSAGGGRLDILLRSGEAFDRDCRIDLLQVAHRSEVARLRFIDESGTRRQPLE